MKTTLLIIIGLTLTISGICQTILPIPKKLYDVEINDGYAKAQRTLHRTTTEKVYFQDGKIVGKHNETFEYFPNGDSRKTSITTRDGKVTDEVQELVIGNFEYRKEGVTAWTKECVKNCSDGGMILTIDGHANPKPKVEQFLASIPNDSRQRAIGYFMYRVSEDFETLEFLDSKIWIGAKGLIQKKEETVSNTYPTNHTSSAVTTYEYEPKDILPLNAPID